MFKKFMCSGIVALSLLWWAGCGVESSRVEGQEEGAGRLHVAIVSVDTERGVPTLVWAERAQVRSLQTHDTADAIARRYLEQHASLYRLSRADLETVYVHGVHDTGRGGVIVFFRQRVGGLEVVRSELKVLMTRELELVALTGNLQWGVESVLREAQGQGLQAVFQQSPDKAVLSALGDLYGVTLLGGLHQVGTASTGEQVFTQVPGGQLERVGISLVRPAQVVPVYYPTAGQLLPAYTIELLTERAGEGRLHGYEYVTHAGDGRVLQRRNRIASDTYSYEVWADADGTPRDGPQEDYTPHPTGQPDRIQPAYILPTRVIREGLVRAGETVDPWLPAGATITAGNNVRAYADHYDPDGFTEGRDIQASVLPGTRSFHHRYDTSRGPLASEAQARAASVQLFYTTNWLHDYFYVSGFDERAGNAQNDNYGRGGAGGDALLAEAQNRGPDARERNNAVIYTPKDGIPPRMELYLWEMPEERSLTLSTTAYATGKAHFGAQEFRVEGTLVLADDGTAPSADGCQAFQNGEAGAIFLVDRGECLYELKAVNAQAAGAAGLIVVNHVPGAPPPDMFGADPPLNATVPVLSVSYEDGQALKALLAGGRPRVAMSRKPSMERDGSLDNTIIAHEWGHLLHYRLVDCGTPQCQAQSEGWGDFIALHMMVREGDDLAGTYGIAGYAAHRLGNSEYYGIRRVPYSRNPAKNALRLSHIADNASLPTQHPLRDNGIENSEIHNAGEVWASMLFDGYLALLDETRGASPRIASFAEARRRMADYVVAGMKLAPVDPTFTEQRDALLMAAQARDPQDMLVLARSFAARGAGSCAKSPARGSSRFFGVVEDGALRPGIQLELMRVDDHQRRFDADDILDAAEVGYLEVKITNPGPVALRGAQLLLSADVSMLSFPGGTTLQVPDVAPFSSLMVPVRVALDPSLVAPWDVKLTVTLSSSDTCEKSVTQEKVEKFNYDLIPSRVDTVEGGRTTWQRTPADSKRAETWKIGRAEELAGPGEPLFDPRNRVWYVGNGSAVAETTLETPAIKVATGGSESFKVTFKHRYWFDYRADPLAYWNGGVIEVGEVCEGDKVCEWKNISEQGVDAGYSGMIDRYVSSGLRGQQAYVARSASWPRMDVITLDFGRRLHGKTVKLRFHIDPGSVFDIHRWEIDDISVQGTENEPFLDVSEDKSSFLPHAEARADQEEAYSGDVVRLDGSGSWSADLYHRDAVTLSWRQTEGPAVLLVSEGSLARQRFKAPVVKQEQVLAFEVQVSDGTFSARDTVRVLVRPPVEALEPELACMGNAGTRPLHPISDDGAPAYGTICNRPIGSLGGAAGYGCLSTGDTRSLPWPLWLLLSGLVAARRRRNC